MITRVGVSLLLIGSCFLRCPTSFAVEQASTSSLPAKITAAYGGSQSIKDADAAGWRYDAQIESLSSISPAANKSNCTLLSRGDEMRLERNYFGQPTVFGYDGTMAWTKTGDWVSRSSESKVKHLFDELHCGLPALKYLEEPSSKSEAVPSKLIEGAMCPGVRVTVAGGKPTTFYADPQTHLIRRCEFMGFDDEQGVDAAQAINYSDYRNIGGYPVAFERTKYTSGRLVTRTHIDRATRDEEIKDSDFSMPAESFLTRLERGPVIIPFEYARNFIVIEARVNNAEAGSYIVDTGASQTVIDKRFHGPQIGPYTTSTVNLTTGSRAVPLSYTKLDRLIIGDLSIDNIACGITDLTPLSNALGRKISGLLGANVLKRFAMTLDYENRKLVLLDPRQVAVPEGAFVIPTTPAFNETAMAVRGKVNDRDNVNFLVDTGANFNKLPANALAALKTGRHLSLGHIAGLDGQKVDLGAIKLKKLQLGELSISDPVFGVATDKTKAQGLFSTNSLGLLGNPIWSKFKLTLDYRGERVIVQPPADWSQLESFFARIETIDRNYLRDSNADTALNSYNQLLDDAMKDKNKPAEALLTAKIAACYADKFNRTKDVANQESARREFEKAGKLASESRNRIVEGKVLAGWSIFCLTSPRSDQDLDLGKEMIEKALRRCPPESTLFSALAGALLKRKQIVQARDFTNQALLLDPANWQALWTKFAICQQENHPEELALVLEQIEQYYPDFPQVKEAKAKLKKPAGSPTRKSSVKKPAAKLGR